MENKLNQDKSKIVDLLSSINQVSIANYNRIQESLTDNLSTAATAYVAIVLALANNSQDSPKSYSWAIITSVLFFLASLIPWMIEKVITTKAHGQVATISSELLKMISSNSWDNKKLTELEGKASKVLQNGRTSLIPIIAQIVLFSLGMIFAVVTTVMMM